VTINFQNILNKLNQPSPYHPINLRRCCHKCKWCDH